MPRHVQNLAWATAVVALVTAVSPGLAQDQETGLGTDLQDRDSAPSMDGGDIDFSETSDLVFFNVLDRAYPNMNLIWTTMPVPVCWEDLDDSSAADRDLVRQAVAESWEAHSALRFSDEWGECKNNAKGIRIAVGDVGPYTKGLGTRLNGKVEGMWLNFTYRTWSPSCARNENARKACNYTIAVHEFGHAIGFAHEQNRNDTPTADCYARKAGSQGDTLLTPWDIHSVMNYCNPEYGNDGRLSELDIFAVGKVYGAP